MACINVAPAPELIELCVCAYHDKMYVCVSVCVSVCVCVCVRARVRVCLRPLLGTQVLEERH